MKSLKKQSGHFKNRRGKSLFYSWISPVSSTNGVKEAWLFCNPFLEEKSNTQPVYKNFAEKLALTSALGKPQGVFRFDYEGTGDSEGEHKNQTLSNWVDDIEDAGVYVQKSFGIDMLHLFGLRLGGTLAYRSRSRFNQNTLPVGHLLLWAPILKGEPILQDALRMNTLTQLAAYKRVIHDRQALLAQLKSGTTVNLMGYSISSLLGDELLSLDLTLNQPSAQGQVHVIHCIRKPNETTPNDLIRWTEHLKGSLETVTAIPFWSDQKFYNPNQIDLVNPSLKQLGVLHV
jgi:uncharacterized protein